jgi:hypothetical protein
MRTSTSSGILLCLVFVFTILIPAVPLNADQLRPLDNAAILMMLGYHVSPAEIVNTIGRNGSNTSFSLTPETYKDLSDAGATDEIFNAMIKAMKLAAKSSKVTPVALRAPSPSASDDPPAGSGGATHQPAPAATPPPQNPLNGPPLPPPQPAPTGLNTGAVPPANPPSVTGALTAPSNSIAASDPRILAAKIPIHRAARPLAKQSQGERGAIYLDWDKGSASPDTVYESGNHILRLVGANTILYTYQFDVKEIVGGGDDLSLWSGLITSTTKILPDASRASAPSDACTLSVSLPPAKNVLSDINSKILAMLPSRPAGGDFKSISLSDSESAWTEIRRLYDVLETEKIPPVQESLKNDNCLGDSELLHALQLILDDFPAMRGYVEEIQKRADSPWVDFPVHLNRTSDYDITVTEFFQHAGTQAKPQKFHLNRGFDVLTLSGGFLFTKLQARTYTTSAQPVPPPAGSPPNTLPTSQNVLSVSGLGSGMRPALVALFNYHVPWSLGKFNNSRDFGFAFSAGPVIDVANGKADTSKFGVLVGGSYHFWQRLFVTAGVHFGEFADFPQGFHAPGDVLPANFGTPVPVKRWTGRFAFAVTFKGKDLSGLTPQGNDKTGAAANPPSTPAKP